MIFFPASPLSNDHRNFSFLCVGNPCLFFVRYVRFTVDRGVFFVPSLHRRINFFPLPDPIVFSDSFYSSIVYLQPRSARHRRCQRICPKTLRRSAPPSSFLACFRLTVFFPAGFDFHEPLKQHAFVSPRHIFCCLVFFSDFPYGSRSSRPSFYSTARTSLLSSNTFQRRWSAIVQRRRPPPICCPSLFFLLSKTGGPIRSFFISNFLIRMLSCEFCVLLIFSLFQRL